MDKLEMVQVALRELGDVKAEEITAFVEERFQTRIEPKLLRWTNAPAARRI